MAHHILEGLELRKSFGGVQALKGVSLHLKEGEFLGIVGGNGAGKTTLFNIISGILPPDNGSLTLTLKGKTFSGIGKSPCALARAGVCRTFQNLRLFQNLTVEEHLLLSPKKEAVISPQKLLEITKLTPFRSCFPTTLSYPDRRKLELIRAISTGGSLLLLDEPAAAMTPAESTSLIWSIRQIAEILPYPLSILVIEHNMAFIRQLCDRIYAMEEGTILAGGNCDTVLSNPTVQKALFG